MGRMAPSDATPPEPRWLTLLTRTPAAQVALFVQQAAELRKLRAELARSRRRECNEACDAIGDEKERLAGELEDARVGLVNLGDRVKDWRRLATQHHDDGMRSYEAWQSARRGRRTRTDERDAWQALYEAGEDAVQLRALTDRVDALSGVLSDVLERFHPETLANGFECVRSESVGVETAKKWRDILAAQTKE